MIGGVNSGFRMYLGIFLEYIVYLVFRFAEEAICLIPEDQTALALGRFFGRVMYVFASDRRAVAIENLYIAFGRERTPEQIRLLALKNFEPLGMLSVEFFRLRRWSHDQLAEKIVLRGQTNFNAAWAPGRRGIFVVMAHFGSFEVLAAMSRFLGTKGSLVVTPVPNRFVNRWMIFRRGGSESGLTTLPHRGIVHHVISALRSGELVVVLADQRGDDTRPVWVDFFGRKTLSNGIFARFAIEGEACVIPLRGVRREDGTYCCEFGEEIPVAVTGDRMRDVTLMSQRFHMIFEKWLREYPEQGFWMHRKFKRKPSRRKDVKPLAVLSPHAQNEA
ncbi:MAG: hypothetical protein P8182_07655 [Deltaproteobacteria bacterium]